jgi:pyrroline-5-carboxylate reductase
MERLGFIGVGALALYTIKGLRLGGYSEPILLSPRNQENADFLAKNHNCVIQSNNQAVVDNSDYIVISTRPADCLETLSQLEFKPGQVLLSVVAGLQISELRTIVDDQIDIVRAMPVSSAEAASSPTLIYPHNDFVSACFNYCGQSISVDNEESFEQASVLACVYSWYFALFEELIQATKSPALPVELSSQLVMGMAKGAAELALANKDQSPGEIAQAIATEGTFSKLGLDLLKDNEAFKPWHDASELLKKQLAASD